MRRPPCHRETRERLDVKMTPMIDVIFLLLIFFVCTASFQPPEEVLPTHLTMPGTTESPVEDPRELEDLDKLVVKIMWRDGQPAWEINQEEYSHLGEIRAVLVDQAKLKNDVPVILDVEGAVPLEHVIDVYDLCRQIGLERVQFAALTDA